MEAEQGWHDLWLPERHEPVGTTFQTLSQHRLRREGNPPISRTGASAQQAGGAALQKLSLCLCRSASPSHPGEGALLLPLPLPLPLGSAETPLQAFSRHHLPRLPVPEKSASVSAWLSRPPGPAWPASSAATLPCAQATPESSRLPTCPVHMQTSGHLHLLFPQSRHLPFYPPFPLGHSQVKANSRVPSFRQYL